MKRILCIFSLLSCLYSITLKSESCENCGFEITDACNHCPSCGLSLVATGRSFLDDMNIHSGQGLSVQSETLFISGYLKMDSATPFLVKRLNNDGMHKSLREAVSKAKTEGRKSELWKDINEYCSIYYQSDAYVILVKAISFRYLGFLREAFQTLSKYINENHLLSIGSVCGPQLQMFYEAALSSYLLHDHNYAVLFFYYFFVNRHISGITTESVNNSIHSAKVVLSTNPSNQYALLLLKFCWSNLKEKINTHNKYWFSLNGFR